MLDYNTKHTNA